MTVTTICIHHWRLEPQEPMRDKYEAVCLYCGAERTYPGDPEEQVYRKLRGQPFGRTYSPSVEDDE